jgi:fructokinase
MALFAGIEMGGTKTILVLGVPGRIDDRIEFPTTSPEDTFGRASQELARWQASHAIDAMGLASFGPVRISPAAPDYGTMLNTPKSGWPGTRVIEALKPSFSGPIALDTDVNAAALAEHELGAARGCGTFVYLTIGTGVGGAIVQAGQPIHGALHPEVGHMRLRRATGDSFAGACPYHGACVEGLISGPALAARFNCSPAEVAADDPRWRTVASDLAELLANLMLAVSPERIVVGGGVAMRQPRLLAEAIARVPECLGGYLGALTSDDLSARIVLPELGNDAGPNGALCLARMAWDSSPDAQVRSTPQ